MFYFFLTLYKNNRVRETIILGISVRGIFFIYIFYNAHCASLSFKIESKRGVNDPRQNVLYYRKLFVIIVHENP